MRGFYLLTGKVIGCIGLYLFSAQLIYAQPSYNMDDADLVTDNTGIIYDNGGPSGDYTGGIETFTICPENNPACIILDFALFITENPSNISAGGVLTIYDGPDATYPEIGSFSGSLVNSNNAFGQVFAGGTGCVTLVFEGSTGFGTAGWEATWTTSTIGCATYATLEAPVDCENAILICNAEDLNYNSNGPGEEELIAQGIQGCITTGESQSAWFIININEFATANIPLEFTIKPKPGGVDYDFIIYGPVEDGCADLGFPTRCSYAEETTAGTLLTGLSSTEVDISESPTLDNEGGAANGFVQSIITKPGDTYYLMVDNFSANNVGFDLIWGGEVLSNGLLDCSICEFNVLLPDTLNYCQGEAIEIPVGTFNGSGDFDYTWSSDTETIDYSGGSILNVNPDVNFSGQAIFTVAVTDELVNNCMREASVVVNIESQFNVTDLIIQSELCPEEVTAVNLLGAFSPDATYAWSIGSANLEGGDLSSTGPIELSWLESGVHTVTLSVELNSCEIEPFLFETEVFPILETPEIACPETASDSTFTWQDIEGAAHYTIAWSIGGEEQEEVQVDTTVFVVEGAVGEEVILTVVANHDVGYCPGLEGSTTCMISDCETPENFDIVGLAEIYCLESAAVPLEGNPSGGIFTIGGDTASVFDPNTLGAGLWEVQYILTDSTGCIFTEIDSVTILGAIAGDFMLPDSVCTGEPISLVYQGETGADTLFSWNLEDANPSTAMGADTLEVTWENAGTFEVELTITSNSCLLGAVGHSVTVLQSPIVPELMCDNAGEGVGSISWTAEDNHLYYYSAAVNGEPYHTDFLETTEGNYEHPDSLANGDTLVLQVFAAMDGEDFCSVSDTVELACVINSCIDAVFTISGLAESYCLGDSSIVDFSIEPSGGDLVMDTVTLEGTSFDVVAAGVGPHTFTYSWADVDSCWSDTTFSIHIYENPTADFSLSTHAICVGESVIATYTGTTGVGDLNWNFGSNLASSSQLGMGMYELTWHGSNTQTITLEVEQNGCWSETIEQTVEISMPPQIPEVTCRDSLDCIIFEWDASSNDSLYVFQFVTTAPGEIPSIGGSISQTNAGYLLCGLVPETLVQMGSFEAVGYGACDNASPSNLPECTTISCDETVTIGILPENICEDAEVLIFNFDAPPGSFFSGDGVTKINDDSAEFDPALVNIGVNQIILTYDDPNTNCPIYTDTVAIEVIETPTANFEVVGGQMEFCIDNEVNFTYLSNSVSVDGYSWNFGTDANPPLSSLSNPPTVSYNSAGLKTITLEVRNNGCLHDTSMVISIVAPLETPVVTCGNRSTTEITFEWTNSTGNTGYSISYTIDASPPITDILPSNTTSYTVPDLSPNQTVTITIIALGSEPCGDSEAGTQSCVAQNCDVVNLEITDLANEYCDTDCEGAIPLTATPTGGVFVLGSDTVTEFNPCGNVGNFTLFYHYTDAEGVCTYQTSQSITVYETPTAEINISGTEACVEDVVQISFGGSTGGNATYDWSFGTNANPATSNVEGPHEVYWATSGVKEIILEVTENGCMASDTMEVEVFDALIPPTIICLGSTQDSVEFSWNDVGGTGEFVYDVYVNGTLEESNQSTFDLTYDLDNLDPQDSVRLVLYAVGNTICGDSETVEQTCVAEDCPTLTPTIENIGAAYCQDVGVIPLLADNIGGNGTGTGVFTLNGDTLTEFDTNRPAGNYTIEYVYTQGSCQGNATHEVEVYEFPNAGIVPLEDACLEKVVEVRYEGTAPAGASFTWSFGEEVSSSVEVAENVWEVVWSSSGVKEVSVEVDANGCVDAATTALEVFVPLETPDLNCVDVTTNQITFEWTKVAAAYRVNVAVNTVPTFSDANYEDERYEATGLNAGDEVRIEVVPVGTAPCGDGTMVTNACVASDCPAETVKILLDNTSFCKDDLAVELLANVEGGVFTMDGNAAPINGFDPAILEVGGHMIYYDYTNSTTNCSYADSLEIQVFDLPVADFDVALQACPNETVVLEFTGSSPNLSETTFEWGDFGGANEVTDLGDGRFELTWNSAGTYLVDLQMTTVEGCQSAFDHTIMVTQLEVDVPSNYTIDQGETVDIEVNAQSSTSDIETYLWGNTGSLSCADCPNPTANPLVSTLYTLEVVDADGCSEERSILIEVNLPEPEPEITIPNAFSPNRDGVNDVFRPIFNELIVGIEMHIYNRWGEKVFESQDIDAHWRGIHEGRLVSKGVYVYWLCVEFAGGATRLMSGNVTVVY